MSDNFTKQTIQRGANPNDGTGDTLRAASGKINNNFDDVYHKLGNEEELMIDIKYENDATGKIITPKKNQILKFDDAEKKFIPKDYIEQTNFTIKDDNGQSFDVSLLDNETDDSKDDRQNDIVIKGGVGVSVRYEDPRQLIFDGFDWDYNSLNNKQFIEDNFAEIFTKIGDGTNQCILDVRSDTPLVTGDILKYDAFAGKFVPAKDVDTTNFSISNGAETTDIFLNQNQGMNENSLTITGNNIGVTIAEQQLILDGFDGNYSSLEETDFIKENFTELYKNLGVIDPLYEVDDNGNFVYETEMIDKVDENGDPVMIQAKNEDGVDLFNQDGTPLMVQDKEEVNVEDEDGNPIKIPKTDSSGEPLFSYTTIIDTRDANEGDVLKSINGKFVPTKSKFNINNIEVVDDKIIQIKSDVGITVTNNPEEDTIMLTGFNGQYHSLEGKEFIDNKLEEIYHRIGLDGETINIDIAGAIENHVLKFDGTNFVPSPDNSTVFNLMDGDNRISTIKDNGTVIFDGVGGVSVELDPDTKTLTIDTTDTTNAIEALQNDSQGKDQELENSIATTNSNLSDLDTKVEDYNTTLTNATNTNAADIATNATNIATEKGRIDAILDAADADKDSFKEVVELIKSIDTENDDALATFKTETNASIASNLEKIEQNTTNHTTLGGTVSTLSTNFEDYKTSNDNTLGTYMSTTDVSIASNLEKIEQNTTNHNTLDETVSTLSTNFEDYKTANDEEIVDIKADVSNNETNISTLSTTSATLQSDLANYKLNISPRIQAVEDNLQNVSFYASDENEVLEGTFLRNDGNKFKPAYISYDEILDKPELFDGDYEKLDNKPELFDGKYSSLQGTPTIPADLSAELQTLRDLVEQLADPIENLRYRLKQLDGTEYTITDTDDDDNTVSRRRRFVIEDNYMSIVDIAEENPDPTVYILFDKNAMNGLSSTLKKEPTQTEKGATSIDDPVWPLSSLTAIYELIMNK